MVPNEDAPRGEVRNTVRAGASELTVLVFILATSLGSRLTAAQATDVQPQLLFLIANTQFTVCHELGHALIATRGIPVLGDEEAFADELAAICFLHPESAVKGDPLAVEKRLAVADAWRLEWALAPPAERPPFWDVHALDIQRYFDIVCLIYGSDPERFAHLPDASSLPWERAWSCEEHEYRQAVHSIEWLVATYGVYGHDRDAPTTSRVSVSYEPASSAIAELLQRTLRETGMLEDKAMLLQPTFRLPRDIRIAVASCLGEATSFWRDSRSEVVLCHELLEHFSRLAELRPCLALTDTGLHEEVGDEIRACLETK
jgi:hypothetical protein